jgi:predicted esterase
MKSKNWSRRSVLACAAISVLPRGAWAQATASAAPPSAAKIPAIAVIDPSDAPQWQALAKDLGWRVVSAPAGSTAIDGRVQALSAAVQDAIKNSGVDDTRVYLAGRAEAAAAVFYTISRVPDLWAAGLAIGGSPQAAIDSDRIFAANFTNVPVLWLSNGPDDQALAEKLKGEKLNLEWRSATGVTNAAVLEWLAKHRRDAFPSEIDCETNSPAFARCYWIEMTRFDVNERNDVLSSSRLSPVSIAALDLGGFGYRKDDAGPGVLISFLPEKYNGPLKMGDRIVALDGRPIENALKYVEMMEKCSEEKPAVVTVQRGKERIRVETRVVLPRREILVTARVQAQYLAAENDIQIISRTVKEMRVTIPPQWALGGRLYWNGLSMEKVDKAGCFLLTIEKELLRAAPCAN